MDSDAMDRCYDELRICDAIRTPGSPALDITVSEYI
jgi:hypothetical protein